MPTRWFIGLASGSSAQGVDAALLESRGSGLDLRVQLLHATHQPYGRDLRELILRLATQAATPSASEIRHLGLLHRLLGETFAAAARQAADRASFSLQRVGVIGCPGYTLWQDADGRFPSTLGLGMAAVVAERTGITTVSDFAARDLAAAGQGVPLTALADYLLLRDAEENRAVVDLGGLARVVFLPRKCRIQEVLGFEAGPGNLLLDSLMSQATGGQQTCDTGGKYAVQGRCLDDLLQSWLAHPFFQRRPPRSLSRATFGPEFVAEAVQQVRQSNGNLHDLLCTATHFVAHGITSALRRFLPAGQSLDRVLLCGGGVKNGLLWRLLEQQLEGTVLDRTDSFGVPTDAREAMSYGVLATLTVDGVAGNVPSATGAAGSRLLGSLTPGSASNWARCLAWMAGQTAHLTGRPD
jgi:anhydro-N-acetylmuramic acid kinase